LKDSLRVEAYGTLDELNAVVGVVRVMNAELVGGHIQVEKLEEDLQWIKNKLFDLGGILATVPDQEFENMPQVTGNDVQKLEKRIWLCSKGSFCLVGERCRLFPSGENGLLTGRAGVRAPLAGRAGGHGEYHVCESSE